MGLSAADKTNVSASWEAAKDKWGANGMNFYLQMFEHNPEIKSQFSNANLKDQPAVFANMVSNWVSGLGNDAAFKATMNGFCKSHKARGNTNMNLFGDALNELTSFMKATTGLTSAQEASWGHANAAILEAMAAGFSNC